ncbi:PTS sugar transporter subunit IIA [Lentibacillus saliphilus]|uniref:PTS sugar transporter subunit IIA n=1 Tax=Lentibacillus saliphilus TaxID=2737028 RepID=UPI001C3083A1|nr:PTS glucose transporter subunit IIA [Lentibacillus saliphilus]
MFKHLFSKHNKKESTNIYAPMNGQIVPLEKVPDPVFSEKMMGDGIAIIPSDGQVRAPVNGEVIQIPTTKHAIGIKTDDGIEILIHIGLETVALNGEGFDVLVHTGDHVKTGDLLINFDLDYIQKHAADVITPIIITNSKDINADITHADESNSQNQDTIIMSVNFK